jgi:hypothetical protein
LDEFGCIPQTKNPQKRQIYQYNQFVTPKSGVIHWAAAQRHFEGFYQRTTRERSIAASPYPKLIIDCFLHRARAPATRLDRAFCDVGVAIDHLKVRQAPKIEQLWPRLVSVFAPDTEQWDAMVNFGIFP